MAAACLSPISLCPFAMPTTKAWSGDELMCVNMSECVYQDDVRFAYFAPRLLPLRETTLGQIPTPLPGASRDRADDGYEGGKGGSIADKEGSNASS